MLSCRRGYAAVAAVLLWLFRSTRQAVLSIITLKFPDAGLGIGQFILGRGKICLLAVYLLVFLVNDTVEPPNLLGLLGVRLLKLTQTLVDQAQGIIHVSTLLCHFIGKDKHNPQNAKMRIHIR